MSSLEKVTERECKVEVVPLAYKSRSQILHLQKEKKKGKKNIREDNKYL